MRLWRIRTAVARWRGRLWFVVANETAVERYTAWLPPLDGEKP